MDVVITIDTEADNQWEDGPVSTHNLKYVHRFQKLCEKYKFKPTYLCTYEVAKDPVFKDFISWEQNSLCEIGSHLHPWTTPPLENEDPRTKIYPSELNNDQFKQKMIHLTELIGNLRGATPLSYRAGRWGFSSEHIPILLELGYQFDCSVTPFCSWASHRGKTAGGPDFRSAPLRPYFLSESDVCIEGHSRLLEIPVTILCNPVLEKYSFLRSLRYHCHPQIISKLTGKIFYGKARWFRPYPQMGTEQLIRVYADATRRKLPLVEMMFHSSELMPGGSPYNQSEADIERLYQRFEQLFDHMQNNRGHGKTLSEFGLDFCKQGNHLTYHNSHLSS